MGGGGPAGERLPMGEASGIYSALSSLFCYESATIKPTMFNPKWTKKFKAMDKNMS